MDNTNTPTLGKLAYFPVNIFAMIMGLCGLTAAWEKAQIIYNLNLAISLPLLLLTSASFALLLASYLGKIFTYPTQVKQELAHPIKLSFFPAISISFILLAVIYLPYNVTIAEPLWLIGSFLHLVLTLYVISSWMHQEHFQIQHMTPAWFIPAVGNVLVPIAGVPLGYTDVSWFFFSIGMLFWIVLLTIVFNRILFHTPIDERLLPTLFILIAPPSVGFLAYTRLTQNNLDSFMHFLFFAGQFLTLLLFSQIRRFTKLQFSLAWWAYSFPLAGITLATFTFYEIVHKPFYFYLGSVLLVILSLVVSMLFIRTLLAALRGKICLPGN